MRSSTRSLLVAFGTAAAIAVTPLVWDSTGRAVEDVPAAVTSPSGPALSAPSPGVVAAPDEAPRAGDPAPVPATGPAAVADPVTPPTAPNPGSAAPNPGSGMGGDLPPGNLPTPSYPDCPITEAGAWWTDPADPYTCIPPGSRPFHEPTPPGIDPELLQPIFEAPETPPGPGDDCRAVGALQCTVTIMGQDYVVTFADGKPVGVMESQQ